MLVQCISNRISFIDRYQGLRETVHAWFKNPSGGFSLTPLKEYVVYGLTYRADCPWYYIADDNFDAIHHPMAYPAPLFKVLDDRVSRYWVFCVSEHERNGIVTFHALESFPEWVRNSEYFEQLVDGDASAVKTFSSYKELLDFEFPNPLITVSAELCENGWVLCPKCFEAWQSESKAGLLQCPMCKAVVLNPLFSN